MSAHRHARTSAVHRLVGAVIGAASCTALAACGSSGNAPAAPPQSTPAAVSATTPSTTTNTTASPSGCDSPAAARVTAALANYPQVTSVEVNGGCHQISIRTSMAPADPLTPTSTRAVAICRAAAKVAYAERDISSITVAWSDGHEAAAGLRNSDCIPG